MRTTTLLVCLSLLGLAAAAPTASAASVGEPTIHPGPCYKTGESLLDRVLDTTYSVKCEVVDLAQFGVGYTIFVVNVVVDAAFQTIAPIVNAVFIICAATVGDVCYQIVDFGSLEGATIQPPDVSLDAQFSS